MLLFLSACTRFAADSTAPAFQPVALYFYSDADLKQKNAVPSVRVERVVETSRISPDLALKMLIKGPTDEEAQRGARPIGGLSKLRNSYIGMGFLDESGMLVIDFTRAARPVLATSTASPIKTAIRKTLSQFSEIKIIRYSINEQLTGD